MSNRTNRPINSPVPDLFSPSSERGTSKKSTGHPNWRDDIINAGLNPNSARFGSDNGGAAAGPSSAEFRGVNGNPGWNRRHAENSSTAEDGASDEYARADMDGRGLGPHANLDGYLSNVKRYSPGSMMPPGNEDVTSASTNSRRRVTPTKPAASTSRRSGGSMRDEGSLSEERRQHLATPSSSTFSYRPKPTQRSPTPAPNLESADRPSLPLPASRSSSSSHQHGGIAGSGSGSGVTHSPAWKKDFGNGRKSIAGSTIAASGETLYTNFIPPFAAQEAHPHTPTPHPHHNSTSDFAAIAAQFGQRTASLPVTPVGGYAASNPLVAASLSRNHRPVPSSSIPSRTPSRPTGHTPKKPKLETGGGVAGGLDAADEAVGQSAGETLEGSDGGADMRVLLGLGRPNDPPRHDSPSSTRGQPSSNSRSVNGTRPALMVNGHTVSTSDSPTKRTSSGMRLPSSSSSGRKHTLPAPSPHGRSTVPAIPNGARAAAAAEALAGQRAVTQLPPAVHPNQPSPSTYPPETNTLPARTIHMSDIAAVKRYIRDRQYRFEQIVAREEKQLGALAMSEEKMLDLMRRKKVRKINRTDIPGVEVGDFVNDGDGYKWWKVIEVILHKRGCMVLKVLPYHRTDEDLLIPIEGADFEILKFQDEDAAWTEWSVCHRLREYSTVAQITMEVDRPRPHPVVWGKVFGGQFAKLPYFSQPGCDEWYVLYFVLCVTVQDHFRRILARTNPQDRLKVIQREVVDFSGQLVTLMDGVHNLDMLHHDTKLDNLLYKNGRRLVLGDLANAHRAGTQAVNGGTYTTLNIRGFADCNRNILHRQISRLNQLARSAGDRTSGIDPEALDVANIRALASISDVLAQYPGGYNWLDELSSGLRANEELLHFLTPLLLEDLSEALQAAKAHIEAAEASNPASLMEDIEMRYMARGWRQPVDYELETVQLHSDSWAEAFTRLEEDMELYESTDSLRSRLRHCPLLECVDLLVEVSQVIKLRTAVSRTREPKRARNAGQALLGPAIRRSKTRLLMILPQTGIAVIDPAPVKDGSKDRYIQHYLGFDQTTGSNVALYALLSDKDAAPKLAGNHQNHRCPSCGKLEGERARILKHLLKMKDTCFQSLLQAYRELFPDAPFPEPVELKTLWIDDKGGVRANA